MILDFIRDNLDGDSWEKWCDAIYRDRYQNQGFVKVPADHRGDAGIEGFTHTGIVYQCYCPEKSYTDQELYEHVRDKVTRDINKLINHQYALKLKSLGIRRIKEWHFVTPEYRDKRLIEHLEKKRIELLEAASKDNETFSYITPEILCLPKVAEDFKVELARLIRNPLVNLKLNAAIRTISEVDWTKCSADKINNLKRKIKIIMKTNGDDDDYKQMVRFWAEAYIKGIEIMRLLQESCGLIYEDLLALEHQYKKDISMKSMMRSDHSVDYDFFMDVLNEFEQAIENNTSCFDKATVIELKHDLVSGWLADCSLHFKVD